MSPTIHPLSPQPSPTRPSTPRPAILQNLLRDQFTLSTWMLLGAALQSLLILLPIRPTYAIAPVFILLLLTMTDTALVTLGWKPNSYLQGTIGQKYSAILPPKNGTYSLEKDVESGDDKDNGKIAILLLGFKVNHPLGLLAPNARSTASHFSAMMKDLTTRAASNGYLGSTSYLGAESRTTKSEILTTFYFRSLADVEAFAHGPVHREAWNWWNAEAKEGRTRHLGIRHEVFEAARGKWESVYLNFERTGLGATEIPVEGEKGVVGWVDPCVDVSRGVLSTHKGRTQGLA